MCSPPHRTAVLPAAELTLSPLFSLHLQNSWGHKVKASARGASEGQRVLRLSLGGCQSVPSPPQPPAGLPVQAVIRRPSSRPFRQASFHTRIHYSFPTPNPFPTSCLKYFSNRRIQPQLETNPKVSPERGSCQGKLPGQAGLWEEGPQPRRQPCSAGAQEGQETRGEGTRILSSFHKQ